MRPLGEVRTKQNTVLVSRLPFQRSSAVQSAVELLSATGEKELGAVYTKPEVVDAILDLAGYRAPEKLHLMKLLEPSFGGGDFLLAAIDRLLGAFNSAGGNPSSLDSLTDSIRGVEIHGPSFVRTRQAVAEKLLAWGASQETALRLVDQWLIQDDFLLTALTEEFDFVIGNPPYVRQERIPAALLAEYRSRYETIYDRADLYIPFIERGLKLLKPGGHLAFICANRWLKNKYGAPLRALAARDYCLRFYIDMEGASAFHSEVFAYPAITVFRRGGSGKTSIARKPEISKNSLTSLTSAMLRDGGTNDPRVEEVQHVVVGSDPWLLDEPERLRLLRRLETELPTLEQAGCRVGIGVATGADQVFIGQCAV